MSVLANKIPPIYLFGAGRFGSVAINTIINIVPDKAIKGFLDNNANKNEVCQKNVSGFPVHSPDTPRRLGENPYIIITSVQYEDDMRRQCRELGYENVATFHDFVIESRLNEWIEAHLKANADRTYLSDECVTQNIWIRNDPAMRLIMLDNIVYKAVTKDFLAQYLYLAESGALDELVVRNLVPKTTVTNLFCDEYQLIFEQEKKIDPPGYTWTYSMLYDAAICYLRLQETLGKYRYVALDANISNFTLADGSAYFLDLGAIYLKPKKTELHFCHWMEVFICPLVAWLVGDYHLFHQLLSPYPSETLYAWGGFYETETWKLLRNKFSADLGCEQKKIFSLAAEDEILVSENEFGVIFPEPSETMRWDSPSTCTSPEDITMYDNVLQIMRHYAGSSQCATDLGGNDGWFAERLLAEPNLDRVICLDYDAIAIDRGYRRIRGTNKKLTLSVWNFLARPPLDYMVGDIVTIMDCVPKSIVIYGTKIDRTLSRIAEYCRSHIFLEFNQNDLREAEVPWHNIDTFTKHFDKAFKLLLREDIGNNRRLFVGKIRP